MPTSPSPDRLTQFQSSDIVIGVPAEANAEPVLLKNRYGGLTRVGLNLMERIVVGFKDIGCDRQTGILRITVMGQRAIEEFGPRSEQLVEVDPLPPIDVDEDFAARMLAVAEVKRVYLTLEEVDGGWPGWQVACVKRARFSEHKIILKQFLTRPGDGAEMMEKKGEQAGEYANVLCEFFGLELQ